MSRRRFVGVFFGIVGAALLAAVLYVAFADLGRHKGRIEAFVTNTLGRPFVIEGPLKLKVFPFIDVIAERVRLGNVPGGSQPQMLEIGKAAVQIRLWSLFSGPPDVHSFELSDAILLLERGPDGKGNWVMGAPEEEEDDKDAKIEVPIVIRSAKLSNVRVIYREAKKPERVVQLDKLSIAPGREKLLAVVGQGKLDTFPLELKGEVGPLGSLLSARDMRIHMQMVLGKMAMNVSGGIGRLDPLDGADLTFKAEHPAIDGVLEELELPLVASGPIRIDTQLKDAGELTRLDFNVKVDDLEASVNGTLETLSLVGSSFKFEAKAADAARLAKVFDVSGVPTATLTIRGNTVQSRKEITFESLTAALVGASLRADGSMGLTGKKKTTLRFKLDAPSLAKLRDKLPELSVQASGGLESSKDRIELKDVKATLGKTQLAGSLLMIGGESKHIDAKLSSPRVDLTPFFPQDKPAEKSAKSKTDRPKKEFMFSEKPLKLDKMKDADAKVHLVFGELVLGDRSLKNLDGNLRVDHGKITFDARAAGAQEGTLQTAVSLVPDGDGAVSLDMKVDISKVRTNLGREDIAPADVPPLSVAMNMKVRGSSPRQMASGANGQLLLTQGAGQTKSGFIAAFGGDFVKQLAGKLNPFAKDNPYMKLDCTIARADIVNGKVTLKPMLLQNDKLTITASGTVDLHTEKLLLDFTTKPREGIGISPGMFTNPLIRLEGTLANPRMGLGAKGIAQGALAAATGGATMIAGGLKDRAAGEKDMCDKTLAEATHPVASQK